MLAGVALSAPLHGATALIQYFATDTQVAAVVFWTFGDLGRTSYREIAIMTIVTLAAFAFFHLNRWSFNAMESGEGTAHGLGLNVKRTRLLNMIVGAFASSAVIAFAERSTSSAWSLRISCAASSVTITGISLPASALAGAVILLLSDVIARMAVASVVLPISAITSFVGAPSSCTCSCEEHIDEPCPRASPRNHPRSP